MAIEDAEGKFDSFLSAILRISLSNQLPWQLTAVGAALEHICSSMEDSADINRALKQIQGVRYDRVNFAQARSRAALNHHFELPPQDDVLEKIAAGNTMVALASSYDYHGATDWARKQGISFPGVKPMTAEA